MLLFLHLWDDSLTTNYKGSIELLQKRERLLTPQTEPLQNAALKQPLSYYLYIFSHLHACHCYDINQNVWVSEIKRGMRKYF